MKKQSNYNRKSGNTHSKSNNYNKKRHVSERKRDVKALCSSEPVLDRNDTRNSRMEDIHSNDISWWNQSPIYSDAVQIPQNRFPGYMNDDRVLLQPMGYGAEPTEVTEKMTTQPGLMVLEYYPTIGYSDSWTSPVNRSFTSLYTQIAAHTNSGNLGFTQASLAMLTVSAYSIATTIGMIKRLLGLRRVWDNGNANLPRVLLMALGQEQPLSATEWEDDRVRLNTLIDSFNSLQIPKYVSIFDRGFQLGYNIYADEDSIEAQFYAFEPKGFYVYQDTENRAHFMTWIDFTQLPGVSVTVADRIDWLLQVLDYQIQQLRATADLGIIMGAYRRAFPSSAAMVFEYLKPEDLTIPFYDRNMLWQINNADVIPGIIKNLDVTENVAQDFIISQPQVLTEVSYGNISSIRAMYTTPRILHSFNGEWNDEFVMEATRLKCILEDGQGPEDAAYIKCCGTEVIHEVQIYALRDGDTIVKRKMPSVLISAVMGTGTNQLSAILVQRQGNPTTAAAFPFDIAALTKFRIHPLIYMYNAEWSGTELPDTDGTNELQQKAVYVGVFGDLYKYAIINKSQLSQLHLAALQSAYLVNVPTNW